MILKQVVDKGEKMKLRNGWLKEQMEKVKKEIESWPKWMLKLIEMEEKEYK